MRLVPYGLLSIGLHGLSPGGGVATACAQVAVTFGQARTMVVHRNERWRAADLSLGRAQEAQAEQRGLYSWASPPGTCTTGAPADLLYWLIDRRAWVGGEYLYGRRELRNGAHGSDSRIQLATCFNI